jgi:putative ubiquitin-RnfH superfamily antitoxin RatB of RatAB toxin-antitoxin module
MAGSNVTVDVVYALPTEQQVIGLQLPPCATVAQAIRQSGLLERYPEIVLANVRVGVFGKIVTLDTVLRAGDRVEIYRPLTVDPKEARRRRVGLRTGKNAKTKSTTATTT